MTIQNLNRRQNDELAKLLIGAAKTIFVASAVALLFPPGGGIRPYAWCLAGAVIAGVLAWIGVRLLADQAGERKSAGRR